MGTSCSSAPRSPPPQAWSSSVTFRAGGPSTGGSSGGRSLDPRSRPVQPPWDDPLHMDLDASVQYAKGVGPQRAEALAKEGVATVEDLLFHLPMRYEDRRQLSRIADLRRGMKVSVSGTITVAGLRRARRMTLYEVRLDDASGRLKALWFNQPFLKDTLPRGAEVVLYGTVE